MDSLKDNSLRSVKQVTANPSPIHNPGKEEGDSFANLEYYFSVSDAMKKHTFVAVHCIAVTKTYASQQTSFQLKAYTFEKKQSKDAHFEKIFHREITSHFFPAALRAVQHGLYTSNLLPTPMIFHHTVLWSIPLTSGQPAFVTGNLGIKIDFIFVSVRSVG